MSRTLGTGSAAGALAPEFLVTPALLDAISPAGDHGGMVLGCSADNEPLSVSVLRPQPTRLVLVGGLYLAHQVALRAYLEVLGPLPAAARRSTWIAVRLDPRRCPAAVAERGGGVTGCHRALIAALSRVRATLGSRGVPARPLDAEQILRAGICAAELSAVAGTRRPVTLSEGWTTVTAGGVGHASYAITGWEATGAARNLNALTGVRALSTTVALSISPQQSGDEVGLRGLVRVSARDPAELAAADGRLQSVSQRLGLTLHPLGGLQAAGLAATLPLGASG